MHNRGRSIKSYSPLLSNVSPCRNKMAFWRKIFCFWVQEFFRTHTFQVAFFRFSARIQFSRPTDVEKGQRLFFIFAKRQIAFLTSKEGQGAILTFKKRQGAFLTFKKGQGEFFTSKKKRAGRCALRKTWNMNTKNFPINQFCAWKFEKFNGEI